MKNTVFYLKCHDKLQLSKLYLVTSCLDLRKEGKRRSGIYEIQFGEEKRSVFCDMSTLGGGWTVIQRRGDFGNPEDFFLRNWTEYRNGFGRPDRELWMGLEYMFLLSNVETVQVCTQSYRLLWSSEYFQLISIEK